MSRYARYLLMLTGRKVSTYLIPLMFVLTFGLTVVIQSVMNESPNPAITQLMDYFYLFPFVFGPLYVATKAINIFKDGEQDGTELMIVSKRITRKKVVMAKFFSLYVHILLFTVFVFVTVSLISLADQHASSLQRMRFSGSITVGVLIVNILMSAIITFIASYVGRIGTMTAAILIPFVFSITSFIMAPLGKGSIKTPTTTTNYVLTKGILSKGHHDNHVGHVYGTDATNAAIKDQQTGFYKYAGYLDIYKQLTSFYTMFQDRDASLANVNQWQMHTNKWASDKVFQLDQSIMGLKGYSSGTIAPNSKLIYSPIIEEKVSQDEVAAAIKEMDVFVETKTDEFINGIVSYIGGNHFQELSQSLVREGIKKMIKDKKLDLKVRKSAVIEKAIAYAWVKVLTNDIKNKRSKSMAKEIFDRAAQGSSAFRFNFTKNSMNNIQGLQLANETYKTYTAKPWVSDIVKYVLWTLLAIILSIVVVFRYMKRDFK